VTGQPSLLPSPPPPGLRGKLGRTQGLASVIASVWTFRRAHRQAARDRRRAGGCRASRCGSRPGGWARRWPRSLLLIGVFVAEGVAGASVIDRYLLGAATVLLLFCAVSLGGWAMLEPGTWMRRVWMLGAAALLAYGVSQAATTVNLTSLRNTLGYHENFHRGLAAALADPTVKAQLRRCPLVSLPNHKLIPDARWILGSNRSAQTSSRAVRRAAQTWARDRTRLERPHQGGERGRVSARGRRVLRGDRRCRRRPPATRCR